ncbi:hypothetical protein [Onishia taeanensis]
MDHRPRIPMTPDEIPTQRVSLVVDFPPRPPGFAGQCDFLNAMPDDLRPKGSPRNTRYLGAVEWAWSPYHTRLDAYYLNPRRRHWLLWIYSPESDDWEPRWHWCLYGYSPKRGVDEKTAAVYLLLDAWREEAVANQLNHYTLLDEAGFLSRDEIAQIASVVWPSRKGRRD